jgi:hypothetical protein
MAGKFEGRVAAYLANQAAHPPPLWPAVASGEKGATVNHRTGAIVVGYIAGAEGYREWLLDWYDRQTREGHQLGECLSVSHWHHEAGPHAAVVVHAARIGDPQVSVAALVWLARDHALRGRFWEPKVRKGSSVHPGARGWGGWQAGKVPSAEQHSAMADEFYRYVEFGRDFQGKYTPGLDAETVQVLRAAPREAMRASAKLVDLSTVVLAAPIYEIR